MMIEQFIAWFIRKKTAESFSFEKTGVAVPPRAPSRPIQLYVHIPFCAELCPYCSFHRFLFREDVAREYFTSLRKELAMYHEQGFSFSEVYIGGGTPTILFDELLETLRLINDRFSPSDISVETNPDRLDAETLKTLSSEGVKRVSVGIQTFDDGILRSVGRYHKYGSGEVLRRRLKDAQGYVQTLNADMIYNFPVQSRDMLLKDIDTLMDINPDQITFYPLMVSSHTQDRMGSLMGRVSHGQEKKFYKEIISALEGRYRPNSAWCFSKKGTSMIDEYVVSNEEYVGAGSGAFGLVGGGIHANTFSLEDYSEHLGHGRFPITSRKLFSKRELSRYALLMGLFGLSLDLRTVRERVHAPVWWLLGPELLFFFLAGGLRFEGSRVRLTRRGQYYWVVMMREFFTGVDNFRDQSRDAAGIRQIAP